MTVKSTISILLPTRKREVGLIAAVTSLRAFCKSANLQFCVRVDDDDTGLDYGFYAERLGLDLQVGPRWGYKQMHRYYDELAARAIGTMLLIWNDDMTMLTPGWDQLLLQHKKKLRIQYLKRDCLIGSVDTTCPAFPKRLFDVLGHTSGNCHVDSWLDYVSEQVPGCKTYRSDIVFHHDRPNDETALERVYDWEAFNGTEPAAQRHIDACKLKTFIMENPSWAP